MSMAGEECQSGIRGGTRGTGWDLQEIAGAYCGSKASNGVRDTFLRTGGLVTLTAPGPNAQINRPESPESSGQSFRNLQAPSSPAPGRARSEIAPVARQQARSHACSARVGWRSSTSPFTTGWTLFVNAVMGVVFWAILEESGDRVGVHSYGQESETPKA